MTPTEYRRRNMMVRVLLAISTGAALLALAATRLDLVAGPARGGAGEAVAGAGGAVTASLAAGALVTAIAAAGQPLWLHLAGIVGATLTAFIAAAGVVTARASTAIEAGASIELRTGGVLMVAAFFLAVAAVVGCLLALRRIARPEEGRARPESLPEIGVSAKASAALGLGLVSLLVPLFCTLAVALGLLANGDIRRSGNQLEGQGRAAAGIAAGIFVLVIVLAGGLLGVLLVSPAD